MIPFSARSEKYAFEYAMKRCSKVTSTAYSLCEMSSLGLRLRGKCFGDVVVLSLQRFALFSPYFSTLFIVQGKMAVEVRRAVYIGRKLTIYSIKFNKKSFKIGFRCRIK